MNSAGVHILRDSGLDPVVGELLKRRHGARTGCGEHVPTPLTRAAVRRSGLIVTATRAHRVAVTALDRSARDRAFTLKELARVAAGLPEHAGIDALIAAAAEAAAADDRDHDDDLDDPHGKAREDYERMAAEAEAAVRALARVLR